MKGCLKFFIGFVVFIAIIGSLDNNDKPAKSKLKTNKNTEVISKEMFGDKWPFTVESGTLECKGYAVFFIHNNIRYGVNGTSHSKQDKDIDAIWKYNEEMMKALKELGDTEGPYPKISIGPIVDRGLKLCK